MIDPNIKKHLDEKSHKPASQPKIELKGGKLDKNSDLTFTFNYEILPKIPVLKFDEIKLNEYKISVDNNAIQKALEELSKSACTFEPKLKKMKKQNKEIK